MADILIDVEVKGQNSVTSAVKRISTLQNNVKLLSNAFKSGGLSQRQYYKGIKQLADASKKSEKELRKYANTLRAEERETKKAAAAAKAYASARRQALEMDRRLTAERLESANAARMQASEEERLKSKFVQGHTAMNIYSKELNDLAQARQLDIITIEQHTQAVLELDVAMRNGTGVFGGYSGGMQGATKKTSRMGVVAQQTGYQVGDFFVQVQSGTDAIVAFGQQATQLAGVLTMFGGNMLFAGTALGIIIPLVTAVAGYFWAASKATKEAADKTETFEDKMKSAREEVRGMGEDLRLMKSGFSNLFEMTLGDNIRAAELEVNRLLGEQGAGVKGARGGQGAAQKKKSDELKAAQDRLKALRLERIAASTITQQIKASEEAEKQLEEAAKATAKALEEKLKRAEGIKAAIESETTSLHKQIYLNSKILQFGEDSNEVRKLEAEQAREQVRQELIKEGILGNNLKKVMNLYDANVKLTEAIDQSAMDAEKAADELERAQKAAGGIAGIDFSNIANGATWASSLADQLERARGVDADKAAGGNVDFFDPRGRLVGSANAGRITRERAVPKENMPGYVPPGVRGSSGDGASAGEKAEDYLRKLTLENELKRKSIGLSEEAARILEITTELEKKKQPIDKERIALIAKEEMATQALIEKNKEYLSYVEATGEQFRAFGESLIDGTTSIEDAFKGLLNNILKSIWDKMVGDPLADLGEKVGSFIFNSVFGSANGNVFSNGSHVQAFANGGVVGGPTMFPMNGGKTGLMGEAGPEAIMPLKRGANGKLGVQMEGGGATQVTQVFNINGNGDEYIMGKIKQAAPAIQEATKASIVQDRRRGGTMKQAFRG